MEIKQNNSYLIHDKCHSSQQVFHIEILLITNVAYKIKWVDTDKITWIKIDEFNHNKVVLENITDILIHEVQNKYKIPIPRRGNICPVCSGIGTIPDSSSTAGHKICTCCNGIGRMC